MRNPYTGEAIHHRRPPGRRTVDYAFFVVMLLGVAYLVAYVWPWWPWDPRLAVSAQAVGFVYLVAGGWGFLRARRHRAHGDAGTNAMLAWIVVPVAMWDLASPVVFADAWFVYALHFVGGGLALLMALLAIRGAGAEPTTERHGVGLG